MSGFVRKWREHTIGSGDIGKRLRAIEKLVESHDTNSASLLLPLLDDPSSEIRTCAASALADLGDARAVKHLAQRALIEREHQALDQIMQSIGSLGPESACAIFIAALDDEDVHIHQAAANALRRFCWDRLKKGTRAKVAVLQDDWAEVVNCGGAAVETLHAVLLGGTPTARRQAAEALSCIGDRTAMEVLVAVMKAGDSDTASREMAAWGLRRTCWDDVDDGNLARAAIITQDWLGISALGSVAVQPLKETLKNPDPSLYEGAVRALNEIDDENALAALVQVLHDTKRESSLREQVAALFADRTDERSLVALISRLSDEIWSVRVASANALEHRGWEPRLDEERALVAMIRKDWEQIERIGEAAIPALSSALGFFNVGREVAKVMLSLGAAGCDALVRALNSKDNYNPTVREVASLALAEIGDARALKPLQAMLQDPDIAVRQFAVWTLERLGWEPTTKSEQAISALAHGDWDQLRGLGASAVEPLLHMTADSLARDEAVATLDHILDAVPGRISIKQLQKLVSLEDMIPDYSASPTVPAKQKGTMGGVKKRARRELLRRGILR